MATKNKNIKYHKLYEPGWLFQKYVVEKLSQPEIQRLVGSKSPGTIRSALFRLKIPIRGIADGMIRNRVDDGLILDKSVIDGCLLGDMGLKSNNPKSDGAYPYLEKTNIGYDHILYVAKKLFSVNPENRIRFRQRDHETDRKRQNQFTFSSLGHKELLSYYKRWYPKWNNYKKVIPDDIEITPDFMLHWFMDDGCSCWNKKKTFCEKIDFATYCFLPDQIEKLNKKIKKSSGVIFIIRHSKYSGGTGYFMDAYRKENIKKFFDFIGSCPVPSMAYKWKPPGKAE